MQLRWELPSLSLIDSLNRRAFVARPWPTLSTGDARRRWRHGMMMMADAPPMGVIVVHIFLAAQDACSDAVPAHRVCPGVHARSAAPCGERCSDGSFWRIL